MEKQGVNTGSFGKWVSDYLKNKDIEVYYDHGDKNLYNKVVAIKGFIAEPGKVKVTNTNRIADVDVLIGKKEEIDLIIEIEERNSNPKKIIGDIFAILMCNMYAIKIKKQEYFNVTNRTHLIVAGILPNKGNRIKKVEEVIFPGINKFVSPNDTIPTTNIKLIFKPNIDETIDQLKNYIQNKYKN